MLIIDVKVDQNEKEERIIVIYESDKPKEVAEKFGATFKLSEAKIKKLEALVEEKIRE